MSIFNKIKKSVIIIFICHIIGFGAFFGYQKFKQSKNTVNVSVVDLVTSNSELATRNNEEGVNVDQKPAVEKQENSVATDNMPPLIKTEPKKETTIPLPKKENVKSANGKIVSKLVSWGFQKSSGRTVKAIIVHTTYNALGGDVFDFDKVIQEWKDAGVAPHYAIDRDGTTYQLVADQNIAWHAGSSKLPDGTTDVNGVSIGIEIVNSKDSKFTDDQYSALNSLIATLKKKYSIKYVLGHDDIAPGRKTDPWGIEWNSVDR